MSTVAYRIVAIPHTEEDMYTYDENKAKEVVVSCKNYTHYEKVLID